MDTFVECDARFVLKGQGLLETAKHIARARKGNGHGAELTEDLVPLLNAGAFLPPGDAVKNFRQSFDTVRGQMYCHVDRVDNPTQDLFGSTP